MELEYIYMLRFLLRDETCELPVVLWRNEAVSSCSLLVVLWRNEAVSSCSLLVVLWRNEAVSSPENQTNNQSLSQDLDFFKKKDLLKFVMELFAKKRSYPSTAKGWRM